MESAALTAPALQENPMAAASFETEKKRIFDGIMKELNNEAYDVRRAIQRHQKQMDAKGVKTPSFDKQCGTQTYDDLQDSIIVNWKLAQNEEIRAKEEEKRELKNSYLEVEIMNLRQEK